MTRDRAWSPLRDENAALLIALMTTMGLIAIDATVLATAVPSVVADLHDYDQFPWLFSIYLLAQAVTVPVYGKLADMFGRKPVMMFGIATFLLGSLLAGFAWSMTSLIAFRAVQGVGAGSVGSITATIVGDVYTLEQRGRVQGYIASVWAVSAVLGPTIGGLFAQLGLWRWIFFINVPLALVAGLLIARRYHERLDRRLHRLDVAGALVLTVGLAALILGVLEGGNLWPWLSAPSLATFGVGFAALALLVPIERRASEPILAFELLGRRLIVTTTLVVLAVGAVTTGLTSFIPSYLTISRGLAPILAGLAVGAMTLGWPLASARSSRLYLRRGFRATIVVGSVITTAAVLGLALTATLANAILVAALSFVTGYGLGLVAAPSLIVAQNSVGWAERGQVTAVNNFARSAGSALGVAVFGAISNSVLAANGGRSDGPGIIAATQAVFWATVVAAVTMGLAALAMPKDAPIAR